MHSRCWPSNHHFNSIFVDLLLLCFVWDFFFFDSYYLSFVCVLWFPILDFYGFCFCVCALHCVFVFFVCCVLFVLFILAYLFLFAWNEKAWRDLGGRRIWEEKREGKYWSEYIIWKKLCSIKKKIKLKF